MNPIILDTTKSLASLVNDKTNGLGRLSECTSCIVQEEINGAYTATIQYPVSGKHYEELNVNGLIKLKPNETGNLQIFRINKISKPFNGIVTIYLNHISYDLSKTSVAPFKTTNASATIAAIKSNMTGGDAFSFSSTVTSQGDFENLVYASARSLLGGDSASVLSIYGGEFEWDNLSVKLVPRRGQDRDISIRRGKNLTDLVQTEDISNYYTNLKAYVKDSDNNIVSSDLQTIVSGVSEENRKILNVDLSSDFDLSEETGLPSVADVNAAAQKYIENNSFGDVQISLTVSFVPLWQTNEYERYAPFERISMGDRINVYYETLSVNANVRMVSYEYDVLNERYNSITLGTVTSTLASTIAGIESGNKNDIAQTENFLQQAINSAKNMLTGAYGGHIVPTFNANKQWNELFAIDTTDPNTATKGLRLNANGLGAFKNGIDGDYVVAITIDGQIVADRITTGTLRAIDIEGVNITGSTITGTTITGTTINGSNINGSTIKFGDDQKNITFEKDDSHDRLNIYGSDDIDINSLGQIRIISSYTYDLGGARSYLSLYNSFNQWNNQYQSAELRTYPSQQSTGVPASLYGNSYINVHNSVLNVDGGNSSYYAFDIVSGIGGRNCSIHGQTNSDTNKGSYVLINGGSRQFRIGDYFNNDYTMYADGHKMIGLSATDQINLFLAGTNILSARNDGRLYARNGVTYGTVVVGRDTHSYSISWDGSHAYLWVDVTRVGQIV